MKNQAFNKRKAKRLARIKATTKDKKHKGQK